MVEWSNKSKTYKNDETKKENKKSKNLLLETVAPIGVFGGIIGAFGSCFTLGSLGAVSSVVGSVGATIGGLISLPMLSIGTIGAGCFYGAYKILTKNDKYKKEEYLNNLNFWNGFFEEIKLMNEDKDLPIFIYDIISENKRTIKFEVPKYITKSFFISRQKLIEEFLGIESGTCKITFKDNFAYIKACYYNDLDKKFALLFKNINIKNSNDEYPEFVYSMNIEHGTRAYYTLPDGISPNFNQDKLDRVKATFECHSIRVAKENDLLVCDIITDALPTVIPYKKCKIEDKSKLMIPFGEDLDGTVFTVFDEANGHMLIGGESGSGKSCATRVSLVSLVQNYTKDYVRLWVGDFKQVELYSFAHTHITDRFATDTDDICRMILDLEYEMKRRYKLFKEYRVNDIRTYNMKAKKKDKMHRIVFFIEEIAMLFQQNSKHKFEYYDEEKVETKTISIKDVHESIVMLGQQARACGLHIWTTIQRPSKDSFDARLKANLSTRYCLSCADEVNSRIILGEEDSTASQLRGNGHAILKNGEGKKELQTYYVPFEELDNLLYDYLTDEGKKLVDEDRSRRM